MAAPARLGLLGLLLPALLGAGTSHSAEDAAFADPPRLASLGEPEVTGSLPPHPPLMAGAEEAIDLGAMRSAIAAYRRGALAEGDAAARQIDDPAARTLLDWIAIQTGGAAAGFARIDGFLRTQPDHPASNRFRRRAEEALLAERKAPATVRAFFQCRQPLSPAGRIALALALKADGKADDALALARRSWRKDVYGQALEKLILAQFGDALTADDHRQRAERLTFKGNDEGARRNALRVSADYARLTALRLASDGARRPLPDSQIEKLPASVRGELSFAFLQAQQARRADRLDEAVKAMAKAPRDPEKLGDGDGWWEERRMLARKLLDAGRYQDAYAVAAGHGAEDAAERIEAEWHAGFIALRFLGEPAKALSHFEAAAAIAETPISVARAAYWQGRARSALGQDEEARTAFERAAALPITYYGQLARARLGLPDLPLRSSSLTGFEILPGQRGLRLLYRLGERDLARTMLADLAQRLPTAEAIEAVAAIARREADPRTLVMIGKAAVQRGFPLDAVAYPTHGVPEFDVLGDPMERAIVHAIARQESAFDPTAMSHAGARGLMQMMPATARETARRAGLPFDWQKLGQDPLYAARMGAAHLNDLLKEWRGSYVLTFAAYNAGSPNVKKWIAAYGDPRDPGVDAIDWVERIPFSETRNYVQRVMENLQVYRRRLNQRTAYLIDHDLKRGGRRD